MLDQEFFNEIMSELSEFEEKQQKEIKIHNNRIFTAIRRVKGKRFLTDLQRIITECECSGKFSFVKTPKGNSQDEYTWSIKKIWVAQYESGDSGDSFYGDIYVKLKDNKYLKMPFVC